MREQPQPVGKLEKPSVLLGGDSGAREVHGLPRLVHGRDDAVPRAGQRAGALQDLVQDGIEVKTRVDVLNCRTQLGDALAQRLHLPSKVVETGHGASLLVDVDPAGAASRIGSMVEPDTGYAAPHQCPTAQS